ncbi:MAG: PEGA domain-containing protein [Spirochaetales bacterium]|nr:PEGA domain-containing protein [Spirochaetales bacterium]
MKKQAVYVILLAIFLVGCVTTTFAQSRYELRIASNVRGAAVYVDGQYAGQTPLTYAVPRGTHTVKVVQRGYETQEKTITVSGNMNFSMNLEVQREEPKDLFDQRTYELRIASNVRDARIYIDNDYKAKTPAVIKVTAGSHTIKVTADGYKDYENTIKVSGNMNFSANLELATRFYSLSISASVRDAKVYINGREQRGYAPVTEKLEQGKYAIKVTSRGYDDYTTDIYLDKDTKIYAKMEPEVRYYTLSITANVKDAKVYIDGKEQRGFAPYAEKLKEGKYSVKVISRSFKPWETEVYLNKDTKLFAELRSYDPKVIIEVPSSILNKKINKPETRIDVYVDGKKEHGLEFEVNAGSHTIRIESGAFALEEKIYFREGKTYTIKLGFGMDISDN